MTEKLFSSWLKVSLLSAACAAGFVALVCLSVYFEAGNGVLLSLGAFATTLTVMLILNPQLWMRRMAQLCLFALIGSQWDLFLEARVFIPGPIASAAVELGSTNIQLYLFLLVVMFSIMDFRKHIYNRTPLGLEVVELRVSKPLSEFTQKDRRALESAIESVLQARGKVIVEGIRDGSTIVELAIPVRSFGRLSDALGAETLRALGVQAEARIVTELGYRHERRRLERRLLSLQNANKSVLFAIAYLVAVYPMIRRTLSGESVQLPLELMAVPLLILYATMRRDFTEMIKLVWQQRDSLYEDGFGHNQFRERKW